MKRVLLLSYYYPPYTGIEGNRIVSWAHTLAGNGFEVVVVTRHWKPGAQHEWTDYFSEYTAVETAEEKVNENLTIIRTPYRWGRHYGLLKKLPLSSVGYWLNKAAGHFHIETDADGALYGTAATVLRRQPFDFIIVSSPPLNIVRLGQRLKKAFGVPLVVDFRDSYNNHFLNPAFVPSAKQKAESIVFKYYLKKWLQHADIVTSVSQAVLQTLPLCPTQKQLVVMNGFEMRDLQMPSIDDRAGLFIVSMVGNLYPEQDVHFMVDGFARFIETVKPDKFLIRFIGIKSQRVVCALIEKKIALKYLQFTGRVPRKDALHYMRSNNLLLQVGWRGYKGFCPGKVFEYLAAGKNILIAPGDGDLTDKVVQETQTGTSVKTIEEMASYLEEKYKEWEACGTLNYKGDLKKIEMYSRESQNRVLANALYSFK